MTQAVTKWKGLDRTRPWEEDAAHCSTALCFKRKKLVLPERVVFLSPRKKRQLCAVKVSSKDSCAGYRAFLALNSFTHGLLPPHEKRRLRLRTSLFLIRIRNSH